MRQIRHQEPRIVLARAARIAQHLGLHDDAPLAIPASRRVARLAVQRRRLPGGARRMRARPSSRRTRLSSRRLLGQRPARTRRRPRSKKVSSLASAKPASARTRSRARGKRARSLAEQPAQQAADPRVAAASARPQQRGHYVLHRLGVERHRGDERQIAPRVVVAVEERELLLAVGGIVGRIEVDRDESHAVAEPLAVVGQDGRRPTARPEPIQVGAAHRILEPRQRRLRAQGRAGERIAVEQQLVDRIVGQPGGVVAVGVAAGQPEHALPQQIAERVRDLARLPPVAEGAAPSAPVSPSRSSTTFSRTAPPSELACGWSNRATIGLAIPVDPQRALRYTGCGHRASVGACVESSCQRSFRTLQGLDGSLRSSFTHNPG